MEGTSFKRNFLTIGFPPHCVNCLGGQAEFQWVSPWFWVPGLGKGERQRDLSDEDQADAGTKNGQVVQRKHPCEGQVKVSWKGESQTRGNRLPSDPKADTGRSRPRSSAQALGFRCGDLFTVCWGHVYVHL